MLRCTTSYQIRVHYVILYHTILHDTTLHSTNSTTLYYILRIYIYMVRRLAFPAPPPPWYGGGGVAGVCGEGWGPLELQLEKRPSVTDQASIVRKP